MYEIVIGRTPDTVKRLGKVGTILLAKQYVTMGRIKNLANPIYLDVAGSHVIMVCGKRGGGKSYTLGVIAEGAANLAPEISENLSFLFFDTMGIYWTMKYPNYRDDKLLQEWDLKPASMPVKIFAPFGLFDAYKEKGIPLDEPFSISYSEVDAEQWAKMFEIDLISPVGLLIDKVIHKVKSEAGKEFGLKEILNAIKEDERASDHEKAVAESRFEAAARWGVFKKTGTPLDGLITGGQVSVLDLSAYAQMEGGSIIKSLVMGLISNKILLNRMASRKEEELKLIEEGAFLTGARAALTEKKAPLVWIVIDEAHEFLPAQGETLASRPLIEIMREGRQPGVSLLLATQQPGKIHTDVMTQSDIVISHRLTAKPDVEALNQMMQSYLPQALGRYLDGLPRLKGTCIILDDKQEKIYPARIRPRFTWHGGEEPSAVKEEMKEFGLLSLSE